MKKRIIIITSEFPPQPGGIGNHAFNLSKYLDKKGFDIVVITDQRSIDGTEEKEFDFGLPYRIVRVPIMKNRIFMYLIRWRKMVGFVRRDDTVIATGKFSIWLVAFHSYFKKFKRIVVVHGSEVNYSAKVKKRTIEVSLKRFNRIVAVSHFTRKLVDHLHENVVVIPNAITLNEWPSNLEVKSINKSPKLVTVGRISERKGQVRVIKHLNYLIKSYPEIEYHCIGINKSMDDFNSEVELNNVERNVHVHGVLSQQNLIQALQSMDIFVMLSTMTSTGDVEGFGIAILEANAMGLPAIGARGSGIEDAISENYSGFLIDGESKAEFDNALKKILENYNEFSQNAKIWAAKHSWENKIDEYIKILL